MTVTRRRIGAKLHSERGASLLLALVLFLICAVMGSVVLAAASTSSQAYFSAEADRRYYALTSAAELLRQEIEGTTVRVRYTPAGADAESDPASIDWYTVAADGSESDGASDFAKALAVAAIYNTNDSDAVSWVSGASEYTLNSDFTVHAWQDNNGGSAEEIGTLLVLASVEKETGAKERTMTITLKNAEKKDTGGGITIDTASDAGQLCITCTADILKEKITLDGKDVVTYTVVWSFSDVSR